jgi:hypothetical protein
METFWRIFDWLWLIARNVFYIGVVVYISDNLSGRTEHILVSILGLIYVSVRGQGLGSAFWTSRMAVALDEEFTRIRILLNDESANAHTDLIKKQKEKADRYFPKIFVSAISLSIVGLICLFELFSNLPQPRF